MSRVYQLTNCPVSVRVNAIGHSKDVDDELIDCNGDIAVEIQVAEDGAEFGVWATSIRPSACGHDDRTIARAEQRVLLGEEA